MRIAVPACRGETNALSDAQGVGQGEHSDQRLATYIVISKPNLKSTAVGICHCMADLL
jgi:hypothetical protein